MMIANPFLGVVLHAIGGVAHGSFYAPLRKLRQWRWETGWLVQGVAAWVLMPWVVAELTGTRPWEVLQQSPVKSLALAYAFGMMWGFGSLTFGLTMRYLGMSLGMAVALGYCAAFGTLIPPLAQGTFGVLLSTPAGWMVLAGVAVCLLGIGLCGYAGIRKEREMTALEKSAAISEFSLMKGFMVATFSGIMSAGFAYGIKWGQPIAEVARSLGAADIFKNAPVFVVVMAGGFTVNCVWCLILNGRNRSMSDYVRVSEAGTGGGAEGRPVLALNYLLAMAAGVIWYTGFFFYGMGTTKMGQYDFSSWSIHLAFVIVFSTICGLLALEWKGVSRRTMGWVVVAILVLILSTVITGFGNALAAK
ncbi:MAG: L-rhamnose/proton symporter RhaT [bacterium]